MIKAVIADDENRICRLIQALGEWDRLGISVAGTAANGLEAIRLVKEERPDILITDIRMPGCDGIQLIERVRQFTPAIHIIIVSGYAEFEYAQAAVRYGVEDYLLKPINKELLNESLSKIRDKILNERETETKIDALVMGKEMNTDAVRASFITDCLIDPGRTFTAEELRDHYQISIAGGCCQFLCAKMDGVPDSKNQKFIWEKFISVFTKQMKTVCREQVYLAQNCYLYGFLEYSAREQEAVRKALRNAMNTVLGLSGVFQNGKISLATGYDTNDVSMLGDAFLSAREMVKERIVQGTGKVIEWSRPRKVLYEKRLLEGYNRAVTGALEFWSEADLLKADQALCDEISKSRDAGGREIFDTVIGAGNIFLTQLHLPDQARQFEVYTETCDDCSSRAQLLEAFSRFTTDQMHVMTEGREDEADRYVRLAKQYIRNHYAEMISLEDVSSYLDLTPAYFSSFFKKKTGIGFAKYLMNVRVDAAKVLLKEGNRPISEISVTVGYNDPRSFNRVFEQVTGVKPATYRKLYG